MFFIFLYTICELYFFRKSSVVFSDNCLFTDFSLGEITSMILLTLELIGSTSLEE